jgi:uncharacterized repeat protein (TIGR03806 family)
MLKTSLVAKPAMWLQLTALTVMSFCTYALDRVPNTTLRMPTQIPDAAFTVQDAFSGLSFSSPVAIVSAPGDANRLFILEKGGRIQVITNLASPNKTLFLDLSAQVNDTREGGLLGLAFHPNFRQNRYIYLFYTTDSTSAAGTGMHDRLSRFEISSTNPNQAVRTTEVVLINQLDEYETHNAGDLHFGADGYLYVSLGDEGGGGDAHNNSQRIDKDFFSAIMRIDVDKRTGSRAPNTHPATSSNYAIPSDNPFIGAISFNGAAVDPAKVRTEFWAVGFRNPWRMFLDRTTGYLYCADVGQDAREELNVVVKGGNYGWKYYEGSVRYGGSSTPPAGVTFIPPILDYTRTGTSGDATLKGNSITGGVVYRGSRLPGLDGNYIFGDYVSGNIWAVQYNGSSASNFRRITGANSPSAFGIDPSNGDVLIAEYGGNRVRRLVSSSSSGMAYPLTLADTGAFSDVATLTPAPGVVPYDINVHFWSDGAKKTRWFSLPNTTLKYTFNPTNNWLFPTSSVWIKHFDLELTNGVSSSARRIETRFIVRISSGVYGVTYRWAGSTANATLVPEGGMTDNFVIRDGSTTRTQVWRYPARNECLVCHTESGGHALGFGTAQMNRSFNYGTTTENQIQAMSNAGYFNGTVGNVQSMPALSQADNESISLEHRARSYLAANCVNCHQPGGTGNGLWDARITTPLLSAGLIKGALLNDYGNPSNQVVRPATPPNSMILTRISTLGDGRMPPLASSVLDTNGMQILTRWIDSVRPPSAPRNLRVTPN